MGSDRKPVRPEVRKPWSTEQLLGAAPPNEQGRDMKMAQNAAHVDIDDIPRSPENPKILRRNNSEVIRDAITPVSPVLLDFFSQESQHFLAKGVIRRITFVVSYVFVHKPPKALNRIQMWAIGRKEMKLDSPSRLRQPLLNNLGMVVSDIIQKHMD